MDAAVKAAQEAFPAWAARMPAILNKIADAIEANIPRLAMIEAKDVSKPIRETTIIDIPTTADQFRYYAGLIRGEEGAVTKVDANTIAKDVSVECFAPLTPRSSDPSERANSLTSVVFPTPLGPSIRRLLCSRSFHSSRSLSIFLRIIIT